jgi:acetoin utilization protein AcuB
MIIQGYEKKESRMQVRDMMQKTVVTATPEMSLAAVQRLMREKRIRHLPVVSGQKLVGMVTDRDIREAVPSPATTLSRGEIAYQMDNTMVRSCMTQKVITVPPDMELVRAARLLLEHKFGCLPVIERGALVGVVTEIDFLQAFLATSNS